MKLAKERMCKNTRTSRLWFLPDSYKHLDPLYNIWSYLYKGRDAEDIWCVYTMLVQKCIINVFAYNTMFICIVHLK